MNKQNGMKWKEFPSFDLGTWERPANHPRDILSSCRTAVHASLHCVQHPPLTTITHNIQWVHP